MKTNDLILLPLPRKMKQKNGLFILRNTDAICCDSSEYTSLFDIMSRLQDLVCEYAGFKPGISALAKDGISFKKSAYVRKQGYKLDISADGIKITYHDAAGAYYAVTTLKQILMQKGCCLPLLSIDDYPDFGARGVMVDISRDKIPEITTILHIADLISDMKMNQLQLYIEGYPFAYESFPKVWQDGTPITGEEIARIDKYCRERFIDFVPNQNSFGHMDAWLNRKEFSQYAECPDGYDNEEGNHAGPGTLGLSDSESRKFLDELYSGLLPYFSSDYFNVGCDETYEVGMGKAREARDKYGAGRVYFDGLMEIYRLVKKHGRKMMFWGDIIMKHPEFIAELPKDIIALEWGYEYDHGFEEDGKRFADAKVPFYVCPGTSSWNSITGRTDNMLGNLENAARNGIKYGAIGYLMTDWGDNGHWQYLPLSYAGYAYAAGISWSCETNIGADVSPYLNRFVYMDESNRACQLILELGRYNNHLKNRMWNCTWVTAMLMRDYHDNSLLPNFSAEEMEDVALHAEKFINAFEKLNLKCKDGCLVTSEMVNGARFLANAARYAALRKKISDGDNPSDCKVMAAMLKLDHNDIVKEHKRLWLARNRYSGLDDSVARMSGYSKFYDGIIDGTIK